MQSNKIISSTGYVLCTGHTTEEGRLCEILIPPHKLNRDDYLCSKVFELDPLLTMCYSRSEKYGVIISLGHTTEFYTITSTGQHTTCKKERIYKARIFRSHNKGGQSQARIGRIHDSLVNDMITSIVKNAIDIYGDQRIGSLNVKSIVLSGHTHKSLMIESLNKIIPTTLVTSSKGGSDEALSIFMKNRESLFLTPTIRKYKKHLIQTIENNYDLILMGYDEVKCFRDYGAIETIYITTLDLEEEMIQFDQQKTYKVIRLMTLPIAGFKCMGIKRAEFKEFTYKSLSLVMY